MQLREPQRFKVVYRLQCYANVNNEKLCKDKCVVSRSSFSYLKKDPQLLVQLFELILLAFTRSHHRLMISPLTHHIEAVQLQALRFSFNKGINWQ